MILNILERNHPNKALTSCKGDSYLHRLKTYTTCIGLLFFMPSTVYQMVTLILNACYLQLVYQLFAEEPHQMGREITKQRIFIDDIPCTLKSPSHLLAQRKSKSVLHYTLHKELFKVLLIT